MNSHTQSGRTFSCSILAFDWRTRLLAVGMVMCLCGSTVFGQTSTTAVDGASDPARGNKEVVKTLRSGVTDAKKFLSEAYRMSRESKTVREFTRTLGMIQKAHAAGLSPSSLDYAKRLASWTYNKRGEAYSADAAAITDDQAALAEQYEKRALQDFKNAIKLNPTWRPLHNRGVSLAMLGEYEKAITDFTAAIKLQPDYPNTRFNRAEIYLQTGQWERAHSDYSRVIRIAPQDVAALLGRAHTRFRLGKYDDAIADYDAALELDPEDAQTHADRADVHAFVGSWQQAAEGYRTAIGLDNQLGRAYQSAAWLMSTCPDERFRDPDLALKAAKRAIELDGNSDYRYLDSLAAAHASAENFEDAKRTAKRAIEMAPEGLVPELTGRLVLYQANKPYRERR